MSENLVLSALLALIEKLIALAQEHKVRRRDVFNEVIHPLYERFQPLAQDYLNLFNGAISVAREAKHPADRNSALLRIRSRREEFYIARRQLRIMLDEFRAVLHARADHDTLEFLEALEMFFYSPETPKLTSMGVQLVDFFELWSRDSSPDTDGNASAYRQDESAGLGPKSSTVHLVEECEKARDRLDDSYSDITRRYVQLKSRIFLG